MKKIRKVLISVYNKSGILPIASLLDEMGITIISTGGTQKFLEKHNIPISPVEKITEYPSILGGRVKTLHPKIFGGILGRSNNQSDQLDLNKFNISSIDMIIIDLYPFQETLINTPNHAEIIEKIDIGGVSLIRAAAKNYQDVFVISCLEDINLAIQLIKEKKGKTTIKDRLLFAQKAFVTTSHYEVAISRYFDTQINQSTILPATFKNSILTSHALRYGENPHQEGIFYGDITKLFDQLNGKSLSYNNLLDVDAAINLIDEFSTISFGILKHNNACGFASNKNITTAWKQALEGDPISAFGGVLITNGTINYKVAKDINKLFFEIIIAPKFEKKALELLKSKKNRIILRKKKTTLEQVSFRTVLNGVLSQQKDYVTDNKTLENVSKLKVSKAQMEDLIFASKICKHTKSNAIVLAKNKQLIGSGCGQTSRVDALQHAIKKAKQFSLDMNNAVMASDAFFPFPDCVEIASKEGIKAVIQPGGSKNDQLSIDYCNNNDMAMVVTKKRHFKH